MKKLLLVEDDLLFCEILKDKLEGKYQLTIEHNGALAFKLLKDQIFDLVITDILLTGRDGLEIIQAIHYRQPSAKVIAVSGGGAISSGSYLNLAKKFGATDIYSKHSPINNLIEKVRLILD